MDKKKRASEQFGNPVDEKIGVSLLVLA